MLRNAHQYMGFVALSDWTLNGAVIMTNFERWKHFMKYTTADVHHDAAYFFDPPTACVKEAIQNVPNSNIFIRMEVCATGGTVV